MNVDRKKRPFCLEALIEIRPKLFKARVVVMGAGVGRLLTALVRRRAAFQPPSSNALPRLAARFWAYRSAAQALRVIDLQAIDDGCFGSLRIGFRAKFYEQKQ